MLHKNYIKDGEINVFVDASLFSTEVIFKCLYWFGEKFHTTVTLIDSQTYAILLKPLAIANANEADLDIYLQKFERDLIDYRLRGIITKETQNVRDLLVAKAFSNGEFDEDPQGDVYDPVGFDPNKVEGYTESV